MTTTCVNPGCDAPVKIKHCRLCMRCYQRWARNHFRLHADETPDVPPANRKQLIDDASYATFKELVAEHEDATTRWLQEQLGVCRRTITRYRARQRAEDAEVYRATA